MVIRSFIALFFLALNANAAPLSIIDTLKVQLTVDVLPTADKAPDSMHAWADFAAAQKACLRVRGAVMSTDNGGNDYRTEKTVVVDVCGKRSLFVADTRVQYSIDDTATIWSFSPIANTYFKVNTVQLIFKNSDGQIIKSSEAYPPSLYGLDSSNSYDLTEIRGSLRARIYDDQHFAISSSN